MVAPRPVGSQFAPAQGRKQQRRPGHVRHYLRSLNQLGLAVALIAFLWSVSPSLLPRSWMVQGLMSGISISGGYGFGVLLGWSARLLRVPSLPAAWRRGAWWALGVSAVVTVSIALWLASGWQRQIRLLVDAPAAGRYLYIGVFAIAAVVAMALIGIFRLFFDITELLASRVRRLLHPVVIRVVVTAVVMAVAVGIFTGVLYSGSIRIAQSAFSTINHGTEKGVHRPSAPQRSGSPASAVPWSSLGKEGRTFVQSGPTPTQITAVTGRPAMMSIRAFAGLSSASGLQAQADLVLRELIRTGAFNRAVIGVATPTGTGWVDSTLTDPLEYMYNGDTAIASMQYSYLPSYLSFLVDRPVAQEAARRLFDTIHHHWSTLPAGHRPRLLAFGESLGAYGGESAFTSVTDLTNRTQGALFAGTPSLTPLWAAVQGGRRTGSPVRLPIYGNGQSVRVSAANSDLRDATTSASPPQVVFLQHASDPVVWWGPDLIWQQPDWLREPRGADVLPQVRWFPFVTFWQVTCDMIVAAGAPTEHGHNYSSEVPTAWAAILRPPHWTAAMTAALTRTQS